MALSSLLDHFIGPKEHLSRDRHADLLCRLEIDNQLELYGLLHWQLSRFCSFQDLVDKCSRAPVHVLMIRSIGHQATPIHPTPPCENSRQPVLEHELYDPLSVFANRRGPKDDQAVGTLLSHLSEGEVKASRFSDLQ